jgi:hypothetical protein
MNLIINTINPKQGPCQLGVFHPMTFRFTLRNARQGPWKAAGAIF